MKNSITSKKNTPSTKKGTATPQKEGISFSWVAKNIFAVVIVLFLLNKFVLDVLGIQHASKKLGDYTSLLSYDDRQPI